MAASNISAGLAEATIVLSRPPWPYKAFISKLPAVQLYRVFLSVDNRNKLLSSSYSILGTLWEYAVNV